MVQKLAFDRSFVLSHRSLKKLTNEKGWKLYVALLCGLCWVKSFLDLFFYFWQLDTFGSKANSYLQTQYCKKSINALKFDKWRNFVPKVPPKCKRCIATKVWWFKWPKLGHIGQLFAFSKDVLFGVKGDVNPERGTLNFEVMTFLYLL